MRIVYFDLDCVRNDHLGCYGYPRDTSPTIDALAGAAVRFTGCYASNSPCLPSRAALFSGRFGINSGVVGNSAPGNEFGFPAFPNLRVRRERMPMFMRHLRVHGMKTVSFSNFADRHHAWWFHCGFSEFHTVNLRTGFETADEVNAVLLPWLGAHADEDDYFLHVNYWDILFPYRAPGMARLIDEFAAANPPPPEWPDDETIRKQLATVYGGRTAPELWFNNPEMGERHPWMPKQITCRADFEQLINGYDASIRYVDDHIGQVLDVFREKGAFDDTVFIVSGDHGDCFGECGGHYMDHTCAADPVMRRPLIIRWPGARGPSTNGALIYQLDLAPTVCEMLDMPVPELWDGVSFAAALRGEEYAGRDYLVCDHGMAALQRAVRTRDHYFIRTLDPGGYPINTPCELYEIEHDPHMLSDLALRLDTRGPNLVKAHQGLATEWLHANLGRHGQHSDPLERMARARDAAGPGSRRGGAQWRLEKLREAGRDGDAAELVERMKLFHPTWRLE